MGLFLPIPLVFFESMELSDEPVVWQEEAHSLAVCFPSVPTRYWAVWWEWTVKQEPLGSGKFQPYLLPSPLPSLLQPREYFIPTPLCCDAITVSARIGLLRHEQLISKGRRWAISLHARWISRNNRSHLSCSILSAHPSETLLLSLLPFLPSSSYLCRRFFSFCSSVPFPYFLSQPWIFVFFLSFIQQYAGFYVGHSSDSDMQ